ncbi:MAG: PhzF family phenazine biosynthesis protein [Bacteroidota bacterium]
MSIGKFYLLDTFCKEPFQGNPTPICILDTNLSAQKMARLAREFNAPVTAFIEPETIEEYYKIRYFTIEGEIPACGHATLGAGSLLLRESTQKDIEFVTIEGVRIKASRYNNMIYLEYPIYGRKDYPIPQELLNALAIKRPKTHFYCHELKSLFIELKNPNLVQQISPDFERLRKSSNELKEVVVMSESELSNYDFVLRSFCPWIGINEDPVTGSIHSVLGPYWKEKTGKADLIAYQASSRSGEIFVKILQNSVKIGGDSKILIAGLLLL